MFDSNADAIFQEYLQPVQLEKIFHEYREKKGSRYGILSNFPGLKPSDYTIPYRDVIQSNCRDISRQVLRGEFQFGHFHRKTINKKRLNQRIVGVPGIQDILVQKALAAAIYPSIETLFRQHPVVNRAICSHRRGKSAAFAALQIQNFIRSGYVSGIRTDIVRFYDSIPRDAITRQLLNLFGPDSLTSLMLVQYINTGLAEASEADREDRIVSPLIRPSGIPVGGVLSGLLSNLYLLDFDLWVTRELSKEYNFKYIRYVDNLLVLTKTDAGDVLLERFADFLGGLGLTLHKAAKTRKIDILNENLEFIDFQFSPMHILIGSRNIAEFKKKLYERISSEQEAHPTLSNPRQRFRRLVNSKINPFISGHSAYCQKCGGLLRLPKSWIRYFSVITSTSQLHALDKWLRETLSRHFHKTYRVRLKRRDYRNAGLASLVQEYYRIQKSRPCTCPSTRN